MPSSLTRSDAKIPSPSLGIPTNLCRRFRTPYFRYGLDFLLRSRSPLKAEDNSGNTLTLPVQASLEHPQPGEWRYAAARIKKRIATISLILRSRTDATVQGELYCDELMLSSAKNSFRLDVKEETGTPLSKTEELAILGVNIHLLRDEPALDLAHAAGFRFVRMDLLWSNAERRGRFRFFAYDLLLRQLEARGMSVLWILDYGHPDHGGGVPRSAEDIAAFSRFAEAVATHYRGRKVQYEIWNEPNNPQFWAPSPNAAEYAVLLREALIAIRRADPSAIVSSGGISNLDVSYLGRVLDRSLASMLTAISVHPYPKNRPEAMIPAYSAMQSWIEEELGGAIQVWVSEWGYSSTLSSANSDFNGHGDRDRMRQAHLAVREILTLWNLGFSRAVWYDLRDDGNDPANPEHNYGLLDSSGHEKPAMHAVRYLLNSAATRKSAGIFPEPPPGVHAMRFDGTGDKLIVVWTDTSETDQMVEFETENLISATDMMGKALETKSGSKRSVRIRITENAGPIYLLFKTGPRQ